MSSFFKNFPATSYRFGNGLDPVSFQNLSVYIDLVDIIKDNVAFYRSIVILEGDRPDQVSLKLYGTTDYHWTFFLMNDNIREGGWPLTEPELKEKAAQLYPNTVLTTRNELTSIFKVGQIVTGSRSGSTGTIVHRNLDLGQLHISGKQTFFNTETITSQVGDEVQSVNLSGAVDEINAVIFYRDGDSKIVDVDPYQAPSSLVTPTTNIEYLREKNDELKTIRVIKPSAIEDIFRQYQQELLA